MALARARRPEQQHVFALADEARRGQLIDERAIHLLVEVEIEGAERAIAVAEARLFDPPRKESILSAHELVGDERRDEVDGRELLGLRLAQSRLEHVGDARKAQLAQRAVEFGEIHSSVLRWMRSR